MIRSVGVCIKARDYTKSRAFYEGLGFPVSFEIGPDKPIKSKDQVVIFGSETGGKFELTDAHPAVKKSVFNESISSSKISFMFEVSSLADIISRAEKMGLSPAVPVRHYYYGTLEVVYKDPDGCVVVFIEPYSPEMAKQLNASEEYGVLKN